MRRKNIAPVTKKVRIKHKDWDEIIRRFRASFRLQYNAQLAKFLGISKEALSQFRIRETLPYDKLIYHALENNLSLNWLFTGHGEMGNDPQLQSENEGLRIQIIRQDAIIEYLKEELRKERLNTATV